MKTQKAIRKMATCREYTESDTKNGNMLNGNRSKKQGKQYEEWLPNGNMPKKQGKQYEEWLPNGNRSKKQ